MAHTSQSTAYHEAGHAVAAIHFHHHVGTVTIQAYEHIHGSACTEHTWGDGSIDREQIIVLFAGYAAQKRFDPTIGGPNETGACQDEEEVAGLLSFHPDLDEQALRQQAHDVIESQWPAVQDVATALMEHTTLDGNEVSLIFDARTAGADWRTVLAQYRQNFKSEE